MVRLFLCLLFTVTAVAQTALPVWLASYPESEPVTQVLPGLVESSYRTGANVESVLAHYRKVWVGAGQPFSPNFNGTGTAIRAAAAECDVLVQVREDGDGSFVKASCASRTPAANPNAAPEVIGRQATTRSGRPIPDRAAMQARVEAMKTRIEEMKKIEPVRMEDYDRPVYPPKPKDPPGIELRWPAWLVHMPGASTGLQVTEGKDQGGRRQLQSRFRSVQPMTAIHSFYENLLNANGFPVGHSRIETGSTLGGVQQNKSGSVHGRYQPDGIGRGGISIDVDFYRTSLNEPIRVLIRVQLIQIYSLRP